MFVSNLSICFRPVFDLFSICFRSVFDLFSICFRSVFDLFLNSFQSVLFSLVLYFDLFRPFSCRHTFSSRLNQKPLNKSNVYYREVCPIKRSQDQFESKFVASAFFRGFEKWSKKL
jgi:hypothetical protein